MKTFFRNQLSAIDLIKTLFRVIDKHNHGIFILDEHKKLLLINSIGEKILDNMDGIKLTRGTIEIFSRESKRKFSTMINNLSSNHDYCEHKSIVVPRPSGRMPYQILLCSLFPYQTEFCDSRCMTSKAIMFVFDPEIENFLSIEQLKQLFGLTPTEAKLAIMLTQGYTLANCAKMLGHKISTSRNILKGVFSKTSTNKQHELTALIMKNSIPDFSCLYK